MKTYHRVLSIAGSDSCGGAGIQADIKTISACGCYAGTAITALTAQNTTGVSDIFPVSATHVKHQIDTFLEDIGADTVKIGMLHNQETIKTVAERLKHYQPNHIVLDPVMVSTSGHHLLLSEAIDVLVKQLIPLANLITPNIPEAALLLDKTIQPDSDLTIYAKALAEQHQTSVLLKAGHQDKIELEDVFYHFQNKTITTLPSKRIHTMNTHGTGCTLSSAIASFLARGYDLENAVKQGKNYINQAIIHGADYKIGQGHGPVMHFFEHWK